MTTNNKHRGTGVFAGMHQPLEAMRALHMAALPNQFQAIRRLHGVQIAELQSAADLQRKGLKVWRLMTSSPKQQNVDGDLTKKNGDLI